MHGSIPARHQHRLVGILKLMMMKLGKGHQVYTRYFRKSNNFQSMVSKIVMFFSLFVYLMNYWEEKKELVGNGMVYTLKVTKKAKKWPYRISDVVDDNSWCSRLRWFIFNFSANLPKKNKQTNKILAVATQLWIVNFVSMNVKD